MANTLDTKRLRQKLLVVDTCQELARGLVGRVPLGELATDGEVEDLGAQAAEEGVELIAVPLDRVHEGEAPVQGGDYAPLLEKRGGRQRTYL